MTNHSEMFQLARTDFDMRRIVASLCGAMDRRELELDRIRVKLGLPEDWSPGYDRSIRMGEHALKSWADRANAINGVGDMWSLVGELCGAMDIIEDRLAQVRDTPAPAPRQASARR